MSAHSEPARRARGRLRAAVAGALVLALAGLGVANASTLTVNGGTVSTAQAGPCASAVTVTRTEPVYLFLWFFLLGYEGVRVSGNLDGCRGREVAVRGVNGTPGVTGTIPTGGSTTVNLGTPRYDTGQTFVVTIDGWQIPATTT
jgi:hypothetical protein